MNDNENEYLLITSIIYGQNCTLEQLPSLSCGLYQTTIRYIESYAVMNQKFNDSNVFFTLARTTWASRNFHDASYCSKF